MKDHCPVKKAIVQIHSMEPIPRGDGAKPLRLFKLLLKYWIKFLSDMQSISSTVVSFFSIFLIVILL